MPYDFMKKLFINKYHYSLKDWYCLVGECFEGTNGWTNPYITTTRNNATKKCLIVSWDDYSWEVEEVE